jgi:hypothetical protein
VLAHQPKPSFYKTGQKKEKVGDIKEEEKREAVPARTLDIDSFQLSSFFFDFIYQVQTQMKGSDHKENTISHYIHPRGRIFKRAPQSCWTAARRERPIPQRLQQ